MRKAINRLIKLGTFGVLLITYLHLRYKMRSDVPNGFKRTFIDVRIVEKNHVDLKYPGYYFNGKTDSTVFLGNHTAPAMLLEADINALDTQFKYIASATSQPLDWPSTFLYARPPFFYLLDPSKKLMMSGVINDSLRISHIQPLPDGFYSAQPLSSLSAIAVNYDTINHQRNIAKYTSNIQIHSDHDPLLQKQVDGKFCTDGELIVCASMNQVMYMYFYRNVVLTTDTNLVFKSLFRTIDTNTVSKISLGRIHHGKAVTFSSAPEIVNKKIYAEGSYFYILSNLKADNEKADAFSRYSVLDR